ncbi:MAG: fumarylacetoacetate hydrolase family protein [Bacteroidia bacterium]|nr:fumarylacetoacetate hydrolase family protein [Bacteroidia bacterium]
MGDQKSVIIENISEMLWQAEKNREVCKPVRHTLGEKAIEMAYRVQQLVSSKKIEAGAIPVGKKVGLTSLAVQQQLGVEEPDFGMLFDNKMIRDGGEISMLEMMQPRVEAEFAFILKKDILKPIGTEEEMMDAIDHIKPALEVVGSRIKDWDIKITDTIADNASASHFVLGQDNLNPREVDLRNAVAKVFKNGELVSEGRGEACMGSPLNSGIWLANKMIELGNPLKKGEIILTGALGPISKLESGDFIQAEFPGLGSLSFSVK